MSRQKLVGWALIIVSAAYILYFLKVRLLEAGPPLENKEWVQFISSILIFMLGTMNVRMAAMRRRHREGVPPNRT
jgi:ABC-type nickel/cobalt efflux system permease component RcnA